MKMKKMLAILAALSVLGTTGLTVGAEDTATTTEPATEAITTTETEAETTAAETTAETETETTVETAAAEENQTVKAEETAEFTFNGIKFQAVEVDSQEYVTLKINRIEADGSIVETNLSGIDLFAHGDYAAAHMDVLEFLSIDDNVLTINAYGGNQSYQYVDGQFVPAGTAPTTTTTTAAETTTTTTTTTTSAADLEAAEKALYEIYAAKYKPVHAIKEDVEYHIVDGVLTSATIIVQDDDEKVVKTFFVTKDGATLINSVPMGGMGYGFKSTDFTCNGYQFYAQIVQPASDADVRSYLTIYVYDKDGNLVPTNINGMQIGSVLYTGVDGKVGWTQGYDWVLSDFFSSNGDSITINRSIAAFIDVSTSMQYTLTSDSTTYTYDAATNTFVATNATNNGSNDGKTDNGSASNAPATKNTSGTPKTGDTTTVPAVAVGLTLTAAGVVAFISKRKK
ncbi:MAG: LPXTG cell wall anchor domain-containing protein [Ruminococcus sp.]|nr:LPXTG cell wall anchor domain-containing protein [Ruminococcus sp.]